jgi:uncharacterized protein (UPF0216 family)
MESEDLQRLLKDCPLLIRMNDGREYFIEKPELIVVADYSAAILVDDNGVKRIAAISLINIASVIQHAAAPSS